MAHEQNPPQQAPAMTLPTLVFGMVEVRRILRELESLDEFLRGMAIRRETKFEMPRVSRMLDALASENGRDLLKGAHRTELLQFLHYCIDNAPAVHISFAADHPLTLLQTGLQPTIAAGCVIRTANKVFDLSLRNQFAAQKHVLTDALHGSGGAS